MEREIIFYDHYFIDFYQEQNTKVKNKIKYVLELIKCTERIPEIFFKHLESTEGLYEVRVAYQSNIYRIFCCFDKGKLIVLFNAFQKKTQKTPKTEIEKALRLKKEYFETKKENEL